MNTQTTDIFIAAIIDRSGSMDPIWPATVEALDSFLTEQKTVGAGWISLTAFDDVVETPYRAWGLQDLPPFKTMTIKPRGMTALLDAIGAALADADRWLADNPWFTGNKLCLILTDGYENASKTETNASIARKIREHEAQGWTFTYLGANQDAWAVAQSLGMTNQSAVANYAASSGAVKRVVGKMSSSTASLRTGRGYTQLQDETED